MDVRSLAGKTALITGAGSGIGVTAICPGIVNTAITRELT